jgi:hypothetical protein
VAIYIIHNSAEMGFVEKTRRYLWVWHGRCMDIFIKTLKIEVVGDDRKVKGWIYQRKGGYWHEAKGLERGE